VSTLAINRNTPVKRTGRILGLEDGELPVGVFGFVVGLSHTKFGWYFV